MRAPAGVSGTRPRRPAQAPTLPFHLLGFRKFPAARHCCRLWPAPPQPSCETGVRMVSFLPASCAHCPSANLPCGVGDNHGHSRKVPVVATCGSPALGPQPSGVLCTSAPVIEARRRHILSTTASPLGVLPWCPPSLHVGCLQEYFPCRSPLHGFGRPRPLDLRLPRPLQEGSGCGRLGCQ